MAEVADGCDGPHNFVRKLFEIVQDPSNSAFVGWSSCGTRLDVRDIEGFTANVLPKYFRHSNYSSFVRLLNMYDFTKAHRKAESLGFAHRNFKRGHPELLSYIQRKATSLSAHSASGQPSSPAASQAFSGTAELRHEVAAALTLLGEVEGRLETTWARCDHVQVLLLYC